MSKILKCPKCQSVMELGYVLDKASHDDVSKWVEGAPKRSAWTGLQSEVVLEIATYRCQGCGYLESYAL